MCKNVKKSYLVQKEELIYKGKKQAKFRRRKEDLPTQGTLNYTISSSLPISVLYIYTFYNKIVRK